MIKAIIFDCFGVLVGSSLGPFIRGKLGHDANLVAKAELLNVEANAGRITYDDFVRGMVELTGEDEAALRIMLDDNPPNIELLRYIAEELKPDYRLGFLSNASDDWLAELFTAEQIDLFDTIVLSFRVGIVKPDQAIYKLCAAQLGVMPEECVMVDDRVDYCEGARQAGMQVVRYHDFSAFKKQLKAILDA